VPSRQSGVAPPSPPLPPHSPKGCESTRGSWGTKVHGRWASPRGTTGFPRTLSVEDRFEGIQDHQASSRTSRPNQGNPSLTRANQGKPNSKAAPNLLGFRSRETGSGCRAPFAPLLQKPADPSAVHGKTLVPFDLLTGHEPGRPAEAGTPNRGRFMGSP